jgi:hypothetical protein
MERGCRASCRKVTGDPRKKALKAAARDDVVAGCEQMIQRLWLYVHSGSKQAEQCTYQLHLYNSHK